MYVLNTGEQQSPRVVGKDEMRTPHEGNLSGRCARHISKMEEMVEAVQMDEDMSFCDLYAFHYHISIGISIPIHVCLNRFFLYILYYFLLISQPLLKPLSIC